MMDHGDLVSLPDSVQQLLSKICEQHALPPPDVGVKRRLVLLGEEGSLEILRQISSSSKIRTLNGYIVYMTKKLARTESTSSPHSCPSPSGSGSPFSASSPAKSFSSPPSRPSPSGSGTPPGDMRRLTSCATSLWGPSTSARLPDSYSSALVELEFKKAFLILSYAGKERLENLIQADDIYKFKDVPKARFELEVWQTIGYHCIEEKERIKNFDLDHGGAVVYHCLVESNGNYRFKGPFYDKRRTHLQKVVGDDNVLLVKFSKDDDRKDSAWTSIYQKVQNIAEGGIFVGLRNYRFFVFKDGGKEKKKKDPTSCQVKCFFVRMESNAFIDRTRPYPLCSKSIHDARCVFMHVHKVDSLVAYMKRFSLILSKTITLDLDFASLNIQEIEDVPCQDENGDAVPDEGGKPVVHTDGTGFISEDLALKCPRNLFKGSFLNHVNTKGTIGLSELEQILGLSKSNIEEPPLLMQVRLYNGGSAAKGTLLVNKKLPPRTIQVRYSMKKVYKDKELNIPTVSALEVVSTSNRPRKGLLSRALIAHLNYGGVPKEYFMELLMNSLGNAQTVHSNKRAALKVALSYGEMDDFLAARMILCGIPLEEPHLQCHLSVLAKEEKKGLKGGKIPISDCFNVMGTADPTGILKRDEVCVILDSGQMVGSVLVYRHPGLHLGDVHVLTAVYVKEIESIVGNSKYGIFFSTQGPRSVADEMAGGDFDGDMYWVSRNPKLLHYFRPSEPWKSTYAVKSTGLRKPTEYSCEELEKELFMQFLTLRFQPSHAAGSASDSWLSFMDRLLVLGDECMEEKECLKQKMLKLIDIYYDALDAPRTGIKVEIPNDLKATKFPHFMEKTNQYNSTSILGWIYDTVDLTSTDTEVRKLPCFDIEVPPACLDKWKNLYHHYRIDMYNALKDKPQNSSEPGQKKQSFHSDLANGVIEKYKKDLYHASELGLSARNEEEIFNDALAIYRVSYDYAKQVNEASKCSFAWKVAGQALCKLYLKMQNDEPITCSKSVLREVLN